nr:immunoglobulin heavy chain junction region [Mus musculus]MBK4197006.1 immunoglobulin heavy chain junction region [Mus musculus]MBK4197007.1 immunoglobulin heavy chain junction region [Mus musculus]MBK4197008.1 immunoglobulin heavy chain junction region [Mus musculus]MBK4197009.1 immunoglobulin heavy chain junction region [Mus musculus]
CAREYSNYAMDYW